MLTKWQQSLAAQLLGQGSQVALYVHQVALIGLLMFMFAPQSRAQMSPLAQSDDLQANSYSLDPAISADGRFVAFTSWASNLVANDNNNSEDVFVHDRQTGETTRVSVNSDGSQVVLARDPAISADGRFVAFMRGGLDTQGVFVRDRQAGETIPIYSGIAADDTLEMSADGSVFAYTSIATYTSSGEIIVYDRRIGQMLWQIQKPFQLLSLDLSANGRFLVLNYDASCVYCPSHSVIRDLQSGTFEAITLSNQSTRAPKLSADGRFTALLASCPSLNCVALFLYDRNQPDEYIYDLPRIEDVTISKPFDLSPDGNYVVFDRSNQLFVSNWSGSMSMVSVSSDGTPGNNTSFDPAISADGRYVAFASWATNLVSDDTNNQRDIFVHDRQTGETTRVSVPNSDPSIDMVELHHQQVPVFSWVTVPTNGTVDGNQVRITANLQNIDPGQVFEVKFLDDETGQELPGSVISTNESEAQYLWDTTDAAWENGLAYTQRTIRVELLIDGSEVDEEKQGIKVRPKPVILVHGFISNADTWGTYQSWMLQRNSDWKGFAVEMNTGSVALPLSRTNTIFQNAAILDSYIEAVRSSENAWQVDIVAHSMGGLITREYVHTFMRSRPVVSGSLVKNFVMLGTPNMGALWANNAFTVGAVHGAPLYMPALYQLTTWWVEGSFNPSHPFSDLSGIDVSAIAGIGYFSGGGGNGDTVVPLTSVCWTLPLYQCTGTNATHNGMLKDLTTIFRTFSELIPASSTINAPASYTVKDTINLVSDSDRQVKSLNLLQEVDHEPQVVFVETVSLPASTNITLSVPVPGASRLGVTLIVSPSVGVVLRDSSGIQVDALPASIPDDFDPMGSLVVENPLAGPWSLEFTNQGSEVAEVPVSVWVEGGSIALSLSVEQPNSYGQIGLHAMLTDGDLPVIGAVVTANVRGFEGSSLTAVLLDDGLHEDGQANDGVYGTTTDPLAPDDYTIALFAEFGGTTWFAANAVKVESTVLPDPPDSAPIRNIFKTLPITLTWSRISWADQYEIQINHDENFDLPLDYSALVSADHLVLDIAVLPEGDYYWRVRARPHDSDWGEWSVVDAFRLDVP